MNKNKLKTTGIIVRDALITIISLVVIISVAATVIKALYMLAVIIWT